MARCIGVLTSGGDSPGMNPCIRTVVRKALDYGMEVRGIRRGFAGLIDNDMLPLSARSVGGIIQRGGTILMTARCPEFKDPQAQRLALRNVNQQGIDALVIIGGNGSQLGALRLSETGLPVVGIPSTIDNDVYGTDIALGVDTALNTILSAIDKIRDTASSHQRAFLIEVMGRGSGYLALMGGLTGGAEVILIPEREATLEEVAETISEAYIRGKSFAIVVAAEGAKLKVQEVARYLEEREIGYEVRVTILGHVQRGGTASAFDRILAARLGAAAIDLLHRGESGKLVGLIGNETRATDLEEAACKTKTLDLDLYELAKILAK